MVQNHSLATRAAAIAGSADAAVPWLGFARAGRSRCNDVAGERIKSGMQADIETAWMLRVATGDEAAMALLFRHAYGDVRTLCARMTLDDDAADDLAQETFLRVLRYANGFRGDARFSTWVFRIARNVCNRYLNDRTRSRTAALENVPGAGAEPPRDTERIELLRHALTKLASDDREVVVLSRLRDLSYRELASVLECTESTARVRVHRALRRLRDIMLGLEQPDAV